MGRIRGGLSTALLVVAGILFPIGVVAAWAGQTIYDSAAFSHRAVQLLDSPAVRREVADRLTEQLARSGNEQAIAFRPAVILALESVVDTDTFRSIFRDAIRRTHEALLAGRGAGAGLDLSDSLAIVSASLELRASGQGQSSGGGLGQSLAEVTQRANALHIWDLEELVDLAAIVGILGGGLLAALSVALSLDRRRAVVRIGWVLVADGALIVLCLKGARVYAGRRIGGDTLSEAVQGALARGTADLNTVGFWIMGYGIVAAAAAGALGSRATRLTPSVVRTSFAAWVERRRATTAGTVALGVVGLLVGLLFIQDPDAILEILVVAAGLWLSYLSVVELLSLIRRGRADAPEATAPAPTRRAARRLGIAMGVVVTVGAVMTVGLVASTRRATQQAEAGGVRACNGAVNRCDLALNQVVFPGTHNSMSSALYPGWLFGEQVNTIRAQLHSGIRAFLIDTHYGVPSSARLPGSGAPIVLTDQAAGVVAQPGEEIDPAVVARANQLAARSPKAANAARGIYLCHNYCELGAVSFDSVLGDVKDFLDTNPNDVVILDIQDATSPADTTAAIERAGLADRVATLREGEPLPTLGELIDAGTTLLVFAEVGGAGGPPWYHQMYEWFQETPYGYPSVEAFDCSPNRGTAASPMLLVNHWVSKKGLADPKAARQANAREVLRARAERCLRERGLMPNIVAVDFGGTGDLVTMAREVNEEFVGLLRGLEADPEPGLDVPPATSSPATVPSLTAPSTSVPPLTVVPITGLTGGDPARFCAALGDARTLLYAWALAASTEPVTEAGQDDLAFAPSLARRLPTYIAAAPAELAARAQPVVDRAQAALSVLRSLGLDDAAIAGLADRADEQFASVTGLDSVHVEPELRAALVAEVGEAALASAAETFSRDNPAPADLFDLGTVPDEVALAAGFGCLTSPAGLIDLDPGP